MDQRQRSYRQPRERQHRPDVSYVQQRERQRDNLKRHGRLTVYRRYTKNGSPPDHTVKIKLEASGTVQTSMPYGGGVEAYASSTQSASTDMAGGGTAGVIVAQTPGGGGSPPPSTSTATPVTTSGQDLSMTTDVESRLKSATQARTSGSNTTADASGYSKVTYDP